MYAAHELLLYRIVSGHLLPQTTPSHCSVHYGRSLITLSTKREQTHYSYIRLCTCLGVKHVM